MKKYALLLTLLIFTFSLQAQSGIKDILNSKEDFKTICNKADAYFKEKYPDKSFKDLTSGEHRDGSFVKYQRWRTYWELHQTERGMKGDVTAHFRKNRHTASSRSSNPFANVAWDNISNDVFIEGQIGMGRTTSVAFHPTNPNIFYVGAAIGGIWKTTDGGQSYIPLGDDLPFLSISSIIVDKNNPNILYIALSDHVWYGSSAIGVYKSTNGGATWSPTPLTIDISENKRIYWMEAAPNNPNRILVGTEKGLYKTEDGFQTVIKVNNEPTTDVKFNLGNNNLVYQVTRTGKYLRSTNSGNSFTFVSNLSGSGADAKIMLTPQNSNKVYFSRGRILSKSLNGGSTFIGVDSLPEANSVNLIAPQNENVLLSGNFEIYRSDNNGTSYNRITDWLGREDLPLIHVDQRNAFTNPLLPDYLYICNDGGLFRYQVSTNEFVDLSNGLIITQYYDIAVAQSNPSIIGGGSQDNGNMYRASNGQWRAYAPTGDGMTQAIDPTNDNIRYWTYQHGGLNRWEYGTNISIEPTEEDGAWETPYRLDPQNPNNIVAGYKVIYRSQDRGDNWQAISGELAQGRLINELAIAPSNTNRIYATQLNELYVKNTSNNNWIKKRTPSPFRITDLEVAPNDMNTIYITVPGYSSGNKVFKSTDAGNTWINISGSLPNVPVNAIEIYKSSTGGLFIGTDVGVFYRDDTMGDWEEYGALPHTQVRDIEIQYGGQLIRVGSYGRGVFEAATPSGNLCTNGVNLDQYISVNNERFQLRNSVTICANESVLLDMGGNFTDDWSFTFRRPDGRYWSGGTGGVDHDQLLIPNIQDRSVNEGVWQVTYTNPSGCSNTEDFTINVKPSTTIIPYVRVDDSGWMAGTTVTVCEGGFFSIGTQVGLQDGLVLTLPDGSSDSTTDGDTFFNFNNATTSMTGTYTLRFTDENGCVNSIDYTVRVNPSPNITPYVRVDDSGWITDTKITVCEGGFFSIGTQTGLQDGLVLTLPDGRTDNTTDGNTFFNFNNATAAMAGTYTLRFTNESGCVGSMDYTVRVNPSPVLDSYININDTGFRLRNSVTVCSGDEVILDFGGAYDNDWTFTFRRPDGTNFSGGTNGVDNDQIRLSNIADGSVNEGVWQATYSSPEGCTNTENFTVNVDACDPCDEKGGDNDMDGVCFEDDCNDSDPSIGAKQLAGTSCDDGDANTINDEIQADGCNCVGLPKGALTMICPNDRNETIATDSDGQVIFFESPNATSSCSLGDDITVRQIEGPVSGNIFPIGVTTITFEATDNCDNRTSCSFNITITKTLDPCANRGGDSDRDGICDTDDNCPSQWNVNQLDTDGDGIGNVCDDTPNGDNSGTNNTCSDATAQGGAGTLTISNLAVSGKVEVAGPSTGWAINLICEGNCNGTETVSNLTAGEYSIKIQTFNPYCYNQITVNVTDTGTSGGVDTDPCANRGGDSDRDGICDTDDNCPNQWNANQLDTDGDGIGNVCDDTANGNNNSTNNTCSDATAQGEAGTLTISHLAASAKVEIAGPSTGWNSNLVCEGNCNETEIISSLATGVYSIKIQTFNPYCYNQITVNVTDTGTSDGDDNDPCANRGGDSNGDGICDDDNDDDNNNNVETNVNCGDLTIAYGAGSVIMTGQSDKTYYFKINDLNNGWAQIFGCSWNCGYRQSASDLPNGNYFITIYNEDWSRHCDTEIEMRDSPFSGSTSSRNAPQLNFEAFRNQRKVELQWLTNSGYKVDYFEVEQASDGINFSKVKQLVNQSWSNDLEYHQIIDEQPSLGKNYYRVKEVYLDGSFAYTQVKEIDFNIDLERISVFPNPAQNELFVNVKSLLGQKGTLTLLNQYGQMVQQIDLANIETDILKINTSKMSNGLYYLNISSNQQKAFTKKILVHRLY